MTGVLFVPKWKTADYWVEIVDLSSLKELIIIHALHSMGDLKLISFSFILTYVKMILSVKFDIIG
jgi:hypothetical protein